jgi:phosphatidylglycerophosphatase A
MPEAIAQAPTLSRPWSQVASLPRLVATVGGCGFIKPAPGTWGTLAALVPVWIWWQLAPVPWHHTGLLIGVLTVSLLGVWAANACIQTTGIQDPGPVVIDEVAGVWTTLLFISPAVVRYHQTLAHLRAGAPAAWMGCDG